MDQLNAGLVVVYFAAGLVALALTTVLLRPLWLPLWRLFRGTQQFLEDWFGEPARPHDGVPERKGAMARLAQLEKNSGSTMHDSVRRIESRVEAIEQQVEQVQESARQAVTAASLAVNEAKVGRAVVGEHAESTRAQVAELRGAVGALASSVSEAEQAAVAKEIGYVRALRSLGLDLTDVTHELGDDEEERP